MVPKSAALVAVDASIELFEPESEAALLELEHALSETAAMATNAAPTIERLLITVSSRERHGRTLNSERRDTATFGMFDLAGARAEPFW